MRLTIAFEDYTLDVLQHTLYKGGRAIRMPRIEFLILVHLMQHRTRAISMREISESVLLVPYDREDTENIGNSVRVHMYRLRQRLRTDGWRLVQTVEGGYVFNGEVTVTASDLPSGSVIERDGRIIHRL